MSNAAINWVIGLELPAIAKYVLFALANRLNEETGRCDPSLTRLQKDTGLARRTVIVALAKLADRRLIERETRGYGTTVYTLLTGAADALGQEPHQCTTGTRVGQEPHQGSAAGAPGLVRQPHPKPKKKPNRNQIETGNARKTRPPAELPITDADRDWAMKNGITANLEAETENMLDHFRGKGERRADWEATRRTWLRNTKRFNGGINGRESSAEAKQRRNRENTESLLRAVARPEVGGSDEC